MWLEGEALEWLSVSTAVMRQRVIPVKVDWKTVSEVQSSSVPSPDNR